MSWCFLLSFVNKPLSSDHLQKVEKNLQISVDKLVRKVLIKSLHHVKCIISVLIDAPNVAF